MSISSLHKIQKMPVTTFKGKWEKLEGKMQCSDSISEYSEISSRATCGDRLYEISEKELLTQTAFFRNYCSVSCVKLNNNMFDTYLVVVQNPLNCLLK